MSDKFHQNLILNGREEEEEADVYRRWWIAFAGRIKRGEVQAVSNHAVRLLHIYLPLFD